MCYKVGADAIRGRRHEVGIRIVHDERFAQAFKELESDKGYQKELESIERKERRLAHPRGRQRRGTGELTIKEGEDGK